MAAHPYYGLVLGNGYETDVLAVLMAADLPPAVTLAVKHAFRLGKKPGEPAIADVGKAITYLSRHRDGLIREASRRVIEQPAEPADDGKELSSQGLSAIIAALTPCDDDADIGIALEHLEKALDRRSWRERRRATAAD